MIGILRTLGLGLPVAGMASSDFLQLLTYTAILVPCDLIGSMVFGTLLLKRRYTVKAYLGFVPLILGVLSAFSFDFTKENDLKSLTAAPATKEGAAALLLVISGRFSNALANILHKKYYVMQGFKDRSYIYQSENNNKLPISKEDIDSNGILKSGLISKDSFLFRNAVLLDAETKLLIAKDE